MTTEKDIYNLLEAISCGFGAGTLTMAIGIFVSGAILEGSIFPEPTLLCFSIAFLGLACVFYSVTWICRSKRLGRRSKIERLFFIND